MYFIGILTRSPIGSCVQTRETLKRLGLKKVHNMGVYPSSPSIRGMLRKTSRVVVWTQVEETQHPLGVIPLNSPRRGFPPKIPRVGQIPYEDFRLGYVERMIR